MVAARSEIFTVNFLVYYKNSFLTLVHSLLASSGAFPNVPEILSTGILVPRCLILDPNLASFLWYLVRLGKFPSAAAGRQPHHQSSTLGTAGNYKIYSGHERAGSGGTAGTPGLRASTGAQRHLGQTIGRTLAIPRAASYFPA